MVFDRFDDEILADAAKDTLSFTCEAKPAAHLPPRTYFVGVLPYARYLKAVEDMKEIFFAGAED